MLLKDCCPQFGNSHVDKICATQWLYLRVPVILCLCLLLSIHFISKLLSFLFVIYGLSRSHYPIFVFPPTALPILRCTHQIYFSVFPIHISRKKIRRYIEWRNWLVLNIKIMIESIRVHIIIWQWTYKRFPDARLRMDAAVYLFSAFLIRS